MSLENAHQNNNNYPGNDNSAVEMVLEYAGEYFDLKKESTFLVGRDSPLDLDDNPYLHRRFLLIYFQEGLWWIENVGSLVAATISDGNLQAWLSPGARIPVMFSRTSVMFTAGPTTYEFFLQGNAAPFTGPTDVPNIEEGDPTIGAVTLTHSQKLLILALAEPVLLGRGTAAEIRPSAEAAARLGWAITKFNRKLDNVCDKLNRNGVKGLRGGVSNLATNRRARLVEYAVASRIATIEELYLLNENSGEVAD